jgi:hypothetical protein
MITITWYASNQDGFSLLMAGQHWLDMVVHNRWVNPMCQYQAVTTSIQEIHMELALASRRLQ